MPITIDFTPNISNNKRNYKFYIREFFAIFYTSYSITQNLFFDIDRIFCQHVNINPDIFPYYKTLLFLGIVAFAWLFEGNKRFLVNVSYILLYPFIVVLYRLPIFLTKRIGIVAVFLPIVQGIATFKERFFFGVMFVTACTLILNFPNKILLMIASGILIGYILVHYYKRVRYAFSSKTPFDQIITTCRLYLPKVTEYVLREKADSKDSLQSEFDKKLTSELVIFCLVNRVLLSFAQRVRSYQEKGIAAVFTVLSLLYTFIMTCVTFGFVYYALHIVNPNYFSGSNSNSIWFYLNISFNNFFGRQVGDFTPVALPATILYNLQVLLSWFFTLILIAISFSVLHKRSNSRISDLITQLIDQGNSVEAELSLRYEMTLKEAMNKLIELKPEIVKVIQAIPYSEDTLT